MRSSQAMVVWLFGRLGLDLALIGDLLEERARGRSTIWYWKQVLMAIWTGIWRVIRSHKVLALRAVVIGCAINDAWILLLNYAHPWVPPFPKMFDPLNHPLLTALLTQFATGWILARTHRAHAIPMVVAFMIWLLLYSVVDSFLSGPRLPLAGYLMWLIPVHVGLLVGGLVGARPKTQPFPPVVD